MAKVTRKSNFSPAKLENAIKRGLLVGAQLIAQRAQAKAPVDTGRLKRSIAAGDIVKVGQYSYSVDIGTNLDYGVYQEFGTGDKSDRPELSKDPSKPGIPPHPYLRPAFEESKEQVKQILAKNVAAGLKR